MSTPSSISPILDHGYWMTQAIQLARDAVALAHPNPRVGAVVVKDGILVGQGFHAFDRLDHAEIIALREAGPKSAGASLYVNLEPCCHTGRTGPCTKAIIAAGIKKVFAAMKDPNPLISGRGISELWQAGIEVHVGIYEPQAREINEDFAKWVRTALPFVTLKAALTLDGQIAQRPRRPSSISGSASRQAVQRFRHQADALLTAIGTVLADNPRLTDRTKKPRRRPLLRVVLDSRLRLPLRSHLVKSARHDVLVFTSLHLDSPRARALARAGVEVFRVPGRAGRLSIPSVLRELGRRQMLNVLIEAGAQLNGSALESGAVDKLVLFYAPKIMGTGGVPLARIPSGWFSKLPPLSNVTVNRCAPDFVLEGYFHDVYRNHRSPRKD